MRIPSDENLTQAAERTRSIKKKIRDELRAAFPAASFQIICRTGRGTVFGRVRIGIVWEGEPPEAAVAAITDKYQKSGEQSVELCGGRVP